VRPACCLHVPDAQRTDRERGGDGLGAQEGTFSGRKGETQPEAEKRACVPQETGTVCPQRDANGRAVSREAAPLALVPCRRRELWARLRWQSGCSCLLRGLSAAGRGGVPGWPGRDDGGARGQVGQVKGCCSALGVGVGPESPPDQLANRVGVLAVGMTVAKYWRREENVVIAKEARSGEGRTRCPWKAAPGLPGEARRKVGLYEPPGRGR